MAPVIQAERLSKSYGRGKQSFLALKNLTLSVEQGEIFGYLGPNGSGKSTTINVLLDFIRATSGHARIFGMDIRREAVSIHRRVGFMPAELSLWKHDRAIQVISDIANMRGDAPSQIAYANQLAERLTLDTTKRIRDFSTGNKRKVGLVLALMHKPELLILDEPTSGLDPLLQQTFNQLMLEAKAEGRTVFLSSHVLSEVQAICDRVGILRNGDLKSVESVHTLMTSGLRKVTLKVANEAAETASARLAALAEVLDLHSSHDTLRFTYQGEIQLLLAQLSDLPVRDLLIAEPSLEEVFLAFYGENGKAN